MSSLPIITATGVWPISLATLNGSNSKSIGLNKITIDIPPVLVLYQVVHILVVEQPDEVKGAEAGRGSKRQVPNDHRAEFGRVYQLVYRVQLS